MVIDEAIERVEGGGGDARSKLERLLTLASAEQARALGSVDLAIREWARRDQAVRWRLGRVDNRRMEYMRSLFAAFCRDESEVEARCLLVLSMLVASRLISANHGDRSRAEVIALAMTRLLD